MLRTGKEYAVALFDLASEQGIEAEIAQELNDVAEIFEKTEGLLDFLRSYGVSKDRRLDVLKNAFEGEVHEYVLSFMCLMCEHEEVALFNSAFEEFKAMYLKKYNISEAVVTSATELTAEEKEKLHSALENRLKCNIKAEYKVDASLIGGIRVDVNGKTIDGTLGGRMRSIKKEVLDNER